MTQTGRFVVLVSLLAAGCGSFLGLGDDDVVDDGSNPDPSNDAAAGLDGAEDSTVQTGGEDSGSSGDAKIDASAAATSDAAKDGAGDGATDPTACNGAVACHRYVFVTSTTHIGSFGLTFANADTICVASADSAGSASQLKGRKWRAFLSTTNPLQDGKSRLGVNGTGDYRLVDGTVIATSFLDLFTAPIDNAINLDETGQVRAGVAVWTGSDSQGNRIVDSNCNNWTAVTNGQAATAGDTSALDGQWTNAGLRGCATEARLYCFEF